MRFWDDVSSKIKLFITLESFLILIEILFIHNLRELNTQLIQQFGIHPTLDEAIDALSFHDNLAIQYFSTTVFFIILNIAFLGWIVYHLYHYHVSYIDIIISVVCAIILVTFVCALIHDIWIPIIKYIMIAVFTGSSFYIIFDKN